MTQKSTYKNRKLRLKLRILIRVQNFSTSDISEYQLICRRNRGLKMGCFSFFIFLERFQVEFMISNGLL